jgi:endonuclease YncB( thermonuclease family)
MRTQKEGNGWRQVVTTKLMKFAIALLMGLVASTAHAAEPISGQPRIVDGDTLVIGNTKIRLAGIDAPESSQVCLDANRKRWACGIEARDRLVAHIGNRSVNCAPTGSDAYGRTLTLCTVAGEDLNAWMVRQGWALAFVRYSSHTKNQLA